ncbi:serpin family protein [Virgibacillus sp. YIM 98842]|uniref:serpin family protein n=1 Tax=Virgibacillus sp. YIM 98842 TaxID=2663533 RepID=UPI0013DA0C56|nr:serpin family protein [Virgibacillus sp. YIM 98842]
MKTVFISVLSVLTAFLLASCAGGEEKEEPGSSVNADIHEGDSEGVVSANNELGFRLFNEIEEEENANIFISPTSLSMALSMIYNGAEGKTKEEIATVLQAENIDLETWNEEKAALFSALQRETAQTQLHIANSIWLQDQYRFQQEFAQNTSDYYAAQQEEINFQSGDAARRINDWVAATTNEKITDMVEEPLNPDLVAILINAIYFKGQWKHEFDNKQTEDGLFHLHDGTTKDTPLMMLQADLEYFENKDFQAAVLPYGDEEFMSMRVFLPKENSSLEALKQKLTNETWRDWQSQFQERKGTILLPKFELEFEVVLNDTLKKLGMESAFSRSGADFSTMIEEDDPLWIDQVKQKTFIEVNEEGTEAAAATSIEMETTAAPVDEPFHMEVNRPFFFTITDDETGTILFMGQITDP